MKIISFISATTRRIVKRPPPILIPSTPPLLQSRNPTDAEEQPQASSSTAPPLAPNGRRGTKRRALLIGIQHRPPNKSPQSAKRSKTIKRKLQQVHDIVFTKQVADDQVLLGCHKDVKAIRNTLIELYGYKDEDITVLVDGDDPDCIMPTEENILKHLDLLVADAEPGDRFFFHFSGHSTQEATDDPDEEDGMNELIVTYDDKTIGDNILHQKLVKPLPIGSRLTAIFDTCHSATMLDLPHYRCNRVYVPWTNKGKRGSLTQQNAVVRKYARPMSPLVAGVAGVKRFVDAQRTSINQRMNSPSPLQPKSKSGSGRRVVERRPNVRLESGSNGEIQTPISAVPRDKHDLWLTGLGGDSPLERCASPETPFCEGWCCPIPDGPLKYPQVISLSAAKDGQRAWEDAKGSSMTQALVNRLLENPSPCLHDLLMNISHDLHDLYLGIHAHSRTYKKEARLANMKRTARGKNKKQVLPTEMDNFQNPQISSLYPLDTRTQRWSP